MRALDISTNIGCKVACTYCPQSSVIKNYLKRSKNQQMSFNTFKECIDKLPKNVLLCFSGFSEAFLNPECIKMVEYANSQNFKIWIITTTVGLKKNDIDILKKCKIWKFFVHLPDNKGHTRIEPNEEYFKILDEIIENIPNLTFLFVKGSSTSKDIHPQVKKYLKKKRKINFNIPMESRCGLVDIGDSSLHRINGPLSKCRRIKGNGLLPNGDVILCCQDFGQKHILGNLLSSSYESLFKSDEYIKVINGLKDDSIDILCRYCKLFARRKNFFLKYYDFTCNWLMPRVKANLLLLIKKNS